MKSAKTLGTDDKEVDLYSEDSGSGKSLDDLLKRSDISAVVIALPIVNQPDYIRKAFLAGKHVLSEKPIAENFPDAVKLVDWYHKSIAPSKLTWAVGENFRYQDNINEAARQIAQSGRILGFRIRSEGVIDSGKYLETEWRKNPTHQGGFLLDGGIHEIAALRRVLGPSNPITTLSANTTQLQAHLPPVDTISATLKTATGATGTLNLSFGTTFRGLEYSVATEKNGTISCTPGEVTVNGETRKVPNERSGVPPEIRAWGEALAEGRMNADQSPEEALADLEIMEACLRSGERGGEKMELKYQKISG